MREVVIAGVGMTSFGRHMDRTYSSLVAESVHEALADARTAPDQIQMVYYSNSAAGLMTGQESVRGQHAVRGSGLEGITLINVENACASGSTALNQAWLAVASGQVDTAIAVGAEKLVHPDKKRAMEFMKSALDQDRLEDIVADLGSAGSGSVFMDIYARFANWYMERSDATVEDFARIAVKNHAHGALNPKAQYGGKLTLDEVLGGRPVSGPLTVPMCAPMSDGSASVVLTTAERAKKWDAQAVKVLGTVVAASRPGEYGAMVPAAAERAYEMAGVGPTDIDVVECHDAASPAELIVMEELGICGAGEAPALLRAGETALGGRIPFNPSGGLGSKGHPVGATGLAQVVELADQLRQRCGDRQVAGARLGLAENAGGYTGPDAAAATITILEA
ncbi:thiolase family protein [Mycolicibacterium sp.]|uniref:thiolase family protein n=1 Tax=Mycolicibacterium sp. TaxID=2320850 RepID=UPI003D0B1FA8